MFLLLRTHRRRVREDQVLEDARVRLLALEHPVLRAVDLREGLAEHSLATAEHHRARRVARVGGCLGAVLAEERAARVLREVQDAPEDGSVLAAALRACRDLADSARGASARRSGARPRGSASGRTACTGSGAGSRARGRGPRGPCARRSATGTSRRSRWGEHGLVPRAGKERDARARSSPGSSRWGSRGCASRAARRTRRSHDPRRAARWSASCRGRGRATPGSAAPSRCARSGPSGGGERGSRGARRA